MRQQRACAFAQNIGQRVGKVPGCDSWKTLVSVTAYYCFSEEVEARTPSRYAALSPHAVVADIMPANTHQTVGANKEVIEDARA
jgi:hypothetical protein